MKAMAPKSQTKGPGTPGRQAKATRSNQYFDVGKVGRKTGLMLRDTGVRDEHGLEPVSGIFSSPEIPRSSPRRRPAESDGSAGMEMERSSAPSVDATLQGRKTPRLPPPRAQTPRKSGIGGSPMRLSTGRTGRHKSEPAEDAGPTPSRLASQPPPNRILQFAENAGAAVRHTVESLSPFKPKKSLRRSTGAVRPDPFAFEAEQDEEVEVASARSVREPAAAERYQQDVGQELAEHAPLMLDEDSYAELQQPPSQGAREESVRADHAMESPTRPKRKRGRPRTSAGSTVDASLGEIMQSRKRVRQSLEDGSLSLSQDEGNSAGPSTYKRKSARPSNADQVIIHQSDGDTLTVDPRDLAVGDSYQAPIDSEGEEVEEEDEPLPQPEPKARGKKGKGKGKAKQETRSKAPKVKPTGSPVKLNDSPSKLRQGMSPTKRGRGGSVGVVSNVNLRASTPYEDAGARVSRYGRPVMQPLQYWRNETYLWKSGEVEGVVRAEDVEKPKVVRRKPNTSKSKKKSRSKLDAIAEEGDSETESIMPDEWEEAMGVIAGTVAGWDSEALIGNPDEPVKEDLGYAASSIVTRDVANSAFTYAKIMTLPFFGSGLVELPPEGYKRTKNSRRMQMVFFVHEGKVLVQVGGTTGVQGAGGDGLGEEFAISKGGVWVVPRGNNYAITNESKTKRALLFFAQGCEVLSGS